MSELAKHPLEKKHRLSRWEIAGIPIILLMIGWVVYSFTGPAVNTGPQTTTTPTAFSGSPYAPDFTLPIVATSGLTGHSLALSSLRGTVVLLEFMEPWCPHCQSMAPVLKQLYEKYPNVIVLSVAGDLF